MGDAICQMGGSNRPGGNQFIARPPSSRPSPPGEGEFLTAALKNLRLDLPDGYSQNKK
jgi:hypothetical protein